MIHLENMTLFIGMKQTFSLKKAWKDPIFLGIILTLVITVIGGFFYHTKSRKLMKLIEEQVSTRALVAQKEKSVSLLRDDVKKINARIQKKSLADGNLTANERKMSQVLEKMALSAGGQRIEVISFRPDTLSEEEKDILLTARVRVKTRFKELEDYLARLSHFPQPIRIDRLKIETPDNETSYIYADLVIVTKINKEKHEN